MELTLKLSSIDGKNNTMIIDGAVITNVEKYNISTTPEGDTVIDLKIVKKGQITEFTASTKQ